MNNTDRRLRFREYLKRETCITPASVFDGTSARIAESLGFEIGMLAGSVASAVVLGSPDIALLTLSDFAEQARRITRSSNLSLMVDADHGYGNALGAMRAVRDLEAAGVAAMTIEDAVLPAKYPHEEVAQLISREEMTKKLCAAIEAREDPTTVIIGRTNSLSIGLQEAMDRVQAYSGTGVDAIFVLGFQTREEIDTIRSVTNLPLMTGGFSPALDHDFLVASGIRVALKGHLSFQASVKAIYDALNNQKNGGSAQDIQEDLSFQDILGMATGSEEFQRWTRQYLA